MKIAPRPTLCRINGKAQASEEQGTADIEDWRKGAINMGRGARLAAGSRFVGPYG